MPFNKERLPIARRVEMKSCCKGNSHMRMSLIYDDALWKMSSNLGDVTLVSHGPSSVGELVRHFVGLGHLSLITIQVNYGLPG